MKVRFLKNFIDIKEEKERHVDEIDNITEERYDELIKYNLVEKVKEEKKEQKNTRKKAIKNENKFDSIYE